MTEDRTIHRGLAGVVVDHTAVSKVNAETNSLLYRGYPVQELGERCSFEEVAWLLWHGELPTAQQATDFTATERAHRGLQPEVRDALDRLPVDVHPMDLLRVAVATMATLDAEETGAAPAETLDRATRLFARLPAVIAYLQRRRRGLSPVEPRDDLGYAANFLWLTFGREPDSTDVRVFETSMVLYAEHSFNASTFAARVATSTLADYWCAIVTGICTLKGPLHGGANEAVMHTFDEIGSADRAAAWLDQALADGRKIMGFGHRVYRHGDSRVPSMKAALDLLGDRDGAREILDLYDALADAMTERKDIQPNLDYPSGPAYRLLGFDTDLFTPIFVASRVTGWTAHILEQRASNALIRPLSEYTGPPERHLP